MQDRRDACPFLYRRVMDKRRIVGIVMTVLFGIAAFVCGFLFVQQTLDAKESAEAFDALAEMVVEQKVDEPNFEIDDTEEDDLEDKAAIREAISRYEALYEENRDFVGWVKIEGTNINYPIMQSREDPCFYLNHGFDKSYSAYGVPFMDAKCSFSFSNNLIVYGHHMNNGTMFADLNNYKDESFWQEHKVIQFDTLAGLGKYEVLAAFAFDTNNDTFMFNEYYNMIDETEYWEFIENCQLRAAYETGVQAELGDKLITLVTCEYTHPNGRFVVVAREIT